jgi:hypothetical protein
MAEQIDAYLANERARAQRDDAAKSAARIVEEDDAPDDLAGSGSADPSHSTVSAGSVHTPTHGLADAKKNKGKKRGRR